MENQTPGQNINISADSMPQAPMPTPIAPMPAMPQTQPMQPAQMGDQGSSMPSGGSSSKRLLWIAIIFVILVVAGFAGWYFYSLNQINNPTVTGYTNNQQAVATPTPTPSTAQVTPIQNASDLNGALNQVDNSTTSGIQQDMNQNASDSTGFSQ